METAFIITDPFTINHSDTNVNRTKNLWNDWTEEEATIVADSVETCWPEEFSSITDRILEKYKNNWASNDHVVIASINSQELLKAELIRKEEEKAAKNLEKQSLVIQHSYNLLYYQAQSHSYYSNPGRQRRYGGQ